MNRGSRSDGVSALIDSDSFNEAPIHESGKLRGPERRVHGGLASMRPRFMNRGSERAAEIAAEPVVASMRPRFMNRGSASG